MFMLIHYGARERMSGTLQKSLESIIWPKLQLGAIKMIYKCVLWPRKCEWAHQKAEGRKRRRDGHKIHISCRFAINTIDRVSLSLEQRKAFVWPKMLSGTMGQTGIRRLPLSLLSENVTLCVSISLNIRNISDLRSFAGIRADWKQIFRLINFFNYEVNVAAMQRWRKGVTVKASEGKKCPQNDVCVVSVTFPEDNKFNEASFCQCIYCVNYIISETNDIEWPERGRGESNQPQSLIIVVPN